MRNQTYNETVSFITRYFGVHDGAVELRACPNVKGETGAESLITRDAAELREFCRRKDVDGIGVYFGAAVRRLGAISGSAANVISCPALWVDIDCVKQGLAGQDVIDALGFLPHPPTVIVNSGGGLHAYWMLEEPIDLPAEKDRASDALRALVHILAGDMQCAEIARIMRLPGTMNSKPATKAIYDGQPAICAIVSDNGSVHDFDALCEWLSDQRAVLHGKVQEKAPVCADDPFVAYARAAGYEPAIDVDAELAAMEHGAEGSRSIHSTQTRVTYSMIARGYDDDEIVATILAATERAAPADQKWNWASEEKAIRRDIQKSRPKQAAERAANPKPNAPISNGSAVLKLVPHEPEPKKEKPPKEGKSQTVIVGKAAIGVWQDRYGPVMHTNGTTHVYDEGIWQEWDDRLAQQLRAIIQEACASLKVEPKTSILNAAKAYFMDRPELIRRNVVFDTHGLLVANDACLDLDTMQVVPHSPAHYATKKVMASLAGDRSCPALHEFMKSAFADQDDGVAIASTFQEWLGAAIMPMHVKSRDLMRGLFVFGPSYTGKTQVSELGRYLLGHEHVTGIVMSDLADRFGRESFIGKRGWIADDAVSEGDFLDAETYKVVVTGETTSAKTKGGKNWNGVFGIPVLLTMNNIARVKDQSDATFNRTLMLRMTNVRDKNAPNSAGKHRSISAKIGAEELTGLLWWAIEGWQRLKARGDFAEPESMKVALKGFQDDSNPVGAWMQASIEPCRDTKVARLDLVASFNGWRSLEHDDAKPWQSNTIVRRIKSIMPGLKTVKLNGETCFCGIRVNEDGLYAWQRTKDTAGFDKKVTFSEDSMAVNRFWAKQTEASEAAPPTTSSTDKRPRF